MNTTGNQNLNSSFMDVCNAILSAAKRTINVAEICIVKQVKNNIFQCEFLNNTKLNIDCYKLQDLDVRVGDLVLVLFTDTDFRSNLVRESKGTTLLEVTEMTHSKNSGVIIGIIKGDRNNDSE